MSAYSLGVVVIYQHDEEMVFHEGYGVEMVGLTLGLWSLISYLEPRRAIVMMSNVPKMVSHPQVGSLVLFLGVLHTHCFGVWSRKRD
jgi:hypothetical protein